MAAEENRIHVVGVQGDSYAKTLEDLGEVLKKRFDNSGGKLSVSQFTHTTVDCGEYLAHFMTVVCVHTVKTP